MSENDRNRDWRGRTLNGYFTPFKDGYAMDDSYNNPNEPDTFMDEWERELLGEIEVSIWPSSEEHEAELRVSYIWSLSWVPLSQLLDKAFGHGCADVRDELKTLRKLQIQLMQLEERLLQLPIEEDDDAQ